MNCKPGDLAYVIRSAAGNEGKPVQVINADVFELPGDLGLARYGHLWRVRSGLPFNSLLTIAPGEEFVFPDAWLRPIRDPGNDARDETLEWLPVPSRETEAA